MSLFTPAQSKEFSIMCKILAAISQEIFVSDQPDHFAQLSERPNHCLNCIFRKEQHCVYWNTTLYVTLHCWSSRKPLEFLIHMQNKPKSKWQKDILEMTNFLEISHPCPLRRKRKRRGDCCLLEPGFSQVSCERLCRKNTIKETGIKKDEAAEHGATPCAEYKHSQWRVEWSLLAFGLQQFLWELIWS